MNDGVWNEFVDGGGEDVLGGGVEDERDISGKHNIVWVNESDGKKEGFNRGRGHAPVTPTPSGYHSGRGYP